MRKKVKKKLLGYVNLLFGKGNIIEVALPHDFATVLL